MHEDIAPPAQKALANVRRFARENQPAPSRRARGPATQQSAISNGTRMLAGVDGRSAHARRFRDLVRAFESEIQDQPISEIRQGLIRHAAALMLRAEQLQAAVVRGEDVDDDQLIRIAGAARRLHASILKSCDADIEDLLNRLDAA